ncbi:MAG: hypothetical protein C0623_00040 [Desulfuromonas sp.]|nr:MAG: hypothetical protein C0623_00040 [Desulfuromonas sp.]
MIFSIKNGILLYLLLLLLIPATVSTVVSAAENSMIERYRLSLKVDPDNPTLHYFLGVALIRENLIKEGLKELRIAYPAYTDSIEMQYNMGIAFSKLGDQDSAMLYLEQAEALGGLDSPDVFPLINAYYNVGLAYLESDNFAAAEEVLLKVLRLDPDRVEVYRLLGDIAARSGREEEAQSFISKYLNNYPDDQSARDYLYALHFNRALKLLGKNDNAGARQSFLKAFELTPDSPLVLYYLGSLDYNQGNYTSAVEKLRAAYPNAPEELEDSTRAMLYNCALQLSQQKRWDKAIRAVEPLTDIAAPRIKDLLLAGNIYLQQGKHDQARKIYLQVLARDPANSKAVVNLANAENGAIDTLFEEGRVLFSRGEYNKALEKFDTVLSIRPNENRSLAYRQKTQERMASDAAGAFADARKALLRNDYPAAVTSANRGLAMQPENREGQSLRQQALNALQQEINQLIDNGQALLARNDFAAAEAQYNKVINLEPDNRRALDGLQKIGKSKHEQAISAVNAGNKALDEGKIKAAKSAFTKALNFSPDYAEAKQGLARLESLTNSLVSQEVQWGRRARSAGQLDQAKKHFRNALALKDSAEIRRELASIDKARTDKVNSLLTAARKARNTKDYAKARTLYRRILDINPEHNAKKELSALESEVSSSITAALDEARRHILNGEYQAAVSSYRQALDLDPANKTALAGLEKGRSKLTTSITDLVGTGYAALDKGDFAGAEKTFNEVLKLDPYNTDAKTALQRLDKIKLIETKPGDENKLYLRGIELYTKGKYAEAVSAWEQVLVIAPDHDKAKMNIEKARRKLKKIKEFQGG